MYITLHIRFYHHLIDMGKFRQLLNREKSNVPEDFKVVGQYFRSSKKKKEWQLGISESFRRILFGFESVNSGGSMTGSN